MHRRSLPVTVRAAVAALALPMATASIASAEGPQPGHAVCRVMPLLVPGRAAQVPSRAHLDYFGGRVVSNIQIVQVLWGAGLYEPFVDSVGPGSLPAFFAAFTGSTYIDALAQYATDRPGVNGTPGTHQRIGLGSFLRQERIAPAGKSLVSDDDIIAELGRQIRAGGLPRPSADAAGNADTVYVVYFPVGKTITVGGGTSCATFCAYHGAFNLDGRNVYYAVMPDMSAGSGCDLGCGAGSPFQNATSIASHELAEVITDPEVSRAAGFTAPLAWYDTFNGETGDICNGISQPLTLADGVRYTVQQFWSNADNACTAGGGVTTPPAVAAAAVPAQPAAAEATVPPASPPAAVPLPAAAVLSSGASATEPGTAEAEKPEGQPAEAQPVPAAEPTAPASAAPAADPAPVPQGEAPVEPASTGD